MTGFVAGCVLTPVCALALGLVGLAGQQSRFLLLTPVALVVAVGLVLMHSPSWRLFARGLLPGVVLGAVALSGLVAYLSSGLR